MSLFPNKPRALRMRWCTFDVVWSIPQNRQTDPSSVKRINVKDSARWNEVRADDVFFYFLKRERERVEIFHFFQ